MRTAADSYDPRTWAAAWTPPARAPGTSIVRRRAVAIGAASAVLAAGAGAAWLSRPVSIGSTGVAAVPEAIAESPSPRVDEVRRTLVLPRAGDLGAALASVGLAPDLAAKVVAMAAPALRPEGEIRAALTMTRDDTGFRLERLEASNGDSSGVIVSRGKAGELTASRVAAQLSERISVRHGTMDGDSFYSSAIAAGVPNGLIEGFAKALAFDFNFATEVAAGDAFEAAYAQQVNASGDPTGAPRLLYASITTATKSAAVYRVPGAGGGEDAWFDSSGRSVVRALMRTPVDGARISSKFGMRFHPVLHFMKLHGGIDFAAPTGTPIYAAGNGTIEWAAMKGANGNLTILRHDNGWLTYYLHQSMFMPGIAPGARVQQGQQIGAIGTTGRSTGPHLHYEVHIDGEKVDPLSIPVGTSGVTLSGPELIAFEKIRDRIDVARASQAD